MRMKKFMVLLMTTVFCLQGSAFGEDAKDIMKKIREKDQNIGKVFKTFRMSYEKKAPWGFNGTFETLIKGEKKRSNNKSGTLTSDVVFDGKTYWSLLAFGGMTTKQEDSSKSFRQKQHQRSMFRIYYSTVSFPL